MPVLAELKKIGMPLENVSVYVQALAEQPALLNPALLEHQSTTALNLASTMKLLTSYASLSILGPTYRWKTEIYTDGSLQNGVLNGNLYIKGYGDPSLTSDDFYRLLSRLHQSGVQEIKGDLVIDNSYFSSKASLAGSFDGEFSRAYNATPSAFLLNQKTSSFRFDADAARVTIHMEPDLKEITIHNQLKLGNADCLSWRNSISYDVKQQDGLATVTFGGVYPANCNEKYLELLTLDESNFDYYLFKKTWKALGGDFNGKVRMQALPPNASKLIQQDSKTLAQILPDMNKWSNNLIARQLLLTISAEKVAIPATEVNGVFAINQWLKSQGLNFNELVIENGSGLSRIERISAQHLGQLLTHAYYSPVMPELISSLPIAALDGTMQRRMKNSVLQGRAHLKTGSINGVYTLAGYVLGQQGERYVVVFMANDAKAAYTKPAQDALLEWVYSQ
ncbi:MAG: D-alanyl-D-alanine carboxypeptidase/D-alanyl-D-alanine-endopeptidase [Methylotenera sp.]|nr:D-alanyl-D-alanine carboxypeptidase/D-alanyl-D-alanine-endopeptidase [Methylotenera sp.]